MRTFIVLLASVLPLAADDAKEFKIVIERETMDKNLVTGTLYLNGRKLGTVYENDAKKIAVGTYPGLIRTKSMRNHAQGPGGIMGNSGDFLIEVAKVSGRTDILLHGGNKPEHSLGCVLCGPVTVDKDGVRHAPEVLKQLRLAYFDGQDQPTAAPVKTITIEVRERKK